MTTSLIFEAISSPNFMLGGKELLSPSSNSVMDKQNYCLEGKTADLKPETSDGFLKHEWETYEKNETANLAWA